MHMNELHDVGISYTTSPFNDKFHKERTWASLDIVDETCEPFPWCLIGFLLLPKCICSHHTHANEQNIKVDDEIFLNVKRPPFNLSIHEQL